MTDDLGLFRQRLRRHYFDLREQLAGHVPGSKEWHDCERAMMATERYHVTLYKEPIVRVHSAGEGRTP